jgi:hypothetical protein
MNWTGRRWKHIVSGRLLNNEPTYYFHGIRYDFTKDPIEMMDLLFVVKHSLLTTYFAWADETNWRTNDIEVYGSQTLGNIMNICDYNSVIQIEFWVDIIQKDGRIPPNLKFWGRVSYLQAQTTRMLNKWAKEVEQ